jgi:hypothetical protein
LRIAIARDIQRLPKFRVSPLPKVGPQPAFFFAQ